MSETAPIVVQATAIAIKGRALMIEGAAGSGKSSLALALIDRGAVLIGDDGVTLDRVDNHVMASPPPNIAGLIELRGIGLVEMPVAPPAKLALILMLGGAEGKRLPDKVPMRDVLGLPIPCLAFDPGPTAPAVRAEFAFSLHGLADG
ncbi:MAG: HPr kinase/phosphorylase [Erythrobacter sp.]